MTDREEIYLGALLHDIGKFAFRAKKTERDMDHELLGSLLIQNELSRAFPAIAQNSQKIISLATRSNDEIKNADRLAAGERKGELSKETRRPLISIFQKIDIKESDSQKKQIPSGIYYHKPEPLTMERQKLEYEQDISLANWQPDEDNMIQNHRSSYTQFLDELETIGKEGNIDDSRAMLTTLYSLMWKYTSNVSSASYQSTPDISLFDHSRITAALAICKHDDKDNLILLGADISGIQHFIYEEIIETKQASKRLRGRSFFVKLLSETIANYIIRELDLYEGNILYNNGGTFEIFIPNTVKNIEKLEELEKKINLFLFRKFDLKLQVIIDWKEEKQSDIIQNYQAIQQALRFRMRQKKRQKSYSILEDIFDEKEVKKGDKKILFENIGKSIPHTKYLIEVIIKNEFTNESRFERVDFEEFGTYWYFVYDEKGFREILGDLNNKSIERVIIYDLESTDIGKLANLTTNRDYPIGLSFKFIANYAPLSKEDRFQIAEFKEIAAKGASNYPLLGVFRADVDNLGFLISKGLAKEGKDDNHTISRFATLSRELDMFFTRDINKIAEEDDIYLTYSGGDDLFAVGSWVKIIDFAQKVEKAFSEYVCSNPYITISGGININKPNYPISRLAQQTGDQEKLAKGEGKESTNKMESKYRQSSNKIIEKNKIAMLDVVLEWDDFEKKIDIAKELSRVITDNESLNSISSSFIYRLLTITSQAFDKNGKINVEKIHRLNGQLHYLFARREMTESAINKNGERMDDEIKKIQKMLTNYFLTKDIETKKRWFETFKIIAYYVIYKNRKLKEKNEYIS